MKLPYFALYPADYLRDTRALDFVQHGIYWLLLVEYYNTLRPIPNDELAICRLLLNGVDLYRYTEGDYDPPNGDVIGVLSPPFKGAVDFVLNTYFYLDEKDGCWHHKRADQEILKALALAKSASEAGKKGATKRWNRVPHSTPIATPIATPMRSQCDPNGDTDTDTDTDTDKKKKKPPIPPLGGNGSKNARFKPPDYKTVRAYCEERDNSVNPVSFVDFYASKGWMVGKAKMRDWKAAVRNWERNR